MTTLVASRGVAPESVPVDAALKERLLALHEPERLLASLDEKLRARGLFFGKNPIPTFVCPHIIPAPQFDRWIDDSEALFALLERLVARALDAPELCRWLGFSDQAIELFRIDSGYRRSVVVARPDAVQRGEAVRFIEVNSDSPAMMTFADEVEDTLADLPEVAPVFEGVTRHRRVPALLDALRACYAEYGGKGEPSIAVVDWPGEKTAHELIKTAELFRALGAPAVVAGPHDLSYHDRRLWVGTTPIDLVYRRVLFRDFIVRRDELAPLLAAYRDGTVCMANPLRSYLVGTKAMLALLHHEGGSFAQLSSDEKALVERSVPRTARMKAGDWPAREGWVLKKAESYGGNDVVIGPLVGDAEWDATLAAPDVGDWVRQELEPVPTMELPLLKDGRMVFEPRFLNWNPFLFGGRHGGSITRVSGSTLINITRGGGLLPTLRSVQSGRISST